MNEPHRKNPTFRIAVFIVVVVLIVIGTLAYNAIKEKREFDQQNAPMPQAASLTTTTGPTGATGASQ
jgi:heme/copper-type cytochrome/quinol oxidase subunit 2